MDGKTQPKVAIVHDWLTDMGGAERVVLALHQAFPEAPIYTSVYEPQKLPLFEGLDIRTTWIQKLPRRLRTLHKLFPVLRVWAFRSLDLKEYDVIISSASAEAKSIKKRPNAVHICYCHTPIRYYWSHYEQYKKDPGFGKLNWLVRLSMPFIVPIMKHLDYQAAQKVDHFIANSTEVHKRISQHYHKDSTIIHPPVDTYRFTGLPEPMERHGFVALGRQVPYKRIDLAVKACSELNIPLTVYGNGSEHNKLVKMAGPNVRFVTGASDQEVASALRSAEAFIFPAEEDFGIVQVEALAAGTPVIAYAGGGALDIVENDKTGVLFSPQTAEALTYAIREAQMLTFNPRTLQRRAEDFDIKIFIEKIRQFVASRS